MTSDSKKFNEVPEYSRSAALQEIQTGDPKRAANALLSLAYFDDDWRWVQDQCLSYAVSQNENIRGIAILCFGHLARIHHKIDIEAVKPVLVKALNDPSEFVRGHANSALSDIVMFCK